MRDIVINTGPIIGLVAGAVSLEWLPGLYGRILIPSEVYQEIEAGGHGNPEILALHHIETRIHIGLEKSELPTDLIRELDLGEASVIHNAKMNGIDTVAIDEMAGRRLARIHGLKVTGSLGILLKAKRHGMIANLSDCITRMRQRDVWISADLVEDTLRQANEL
jgi:predicted nucleic acid-binding protein